jgi:fructoselysine 6-phosphate deglycase
MLDTPCATQIGQALEAAKSRKTVGEIYFVACGGSFALMLPNQYAVDRESKSIAGFAINAAEFTSRAPRRLGENSIVILCSHSGTTPETVEAARVARAKGALTIALTNVPGSPLDEAAEKTVFYSHAPLSMSADHSAAALYRLTFGILDVREGCSKAPALESALDGLPKLVEGIQASHADKIAAYAEAHKREPVIYTMASGANYGVAYSYAICIYQEMQWIHSAAIHSGEYFHGPFEITDFDVPFVFLMGLGNSRAMDARALAFASKYSKRLTVLDAAEFGLAELPEGLGEYIAPLVFSPLLRAYADKLADAKGHPLSVRRYMWKMDY